MHTSLTGRHSWHTKKSPCRSKRTKACLTIYAKRLDVHAMATETATHLDPIKSNCHEAGLRAECLPVSSVHWAVYVRLPLATNWQTIWGPEKWILFLPLRRLMKQNNLVLHRKISFSPWMILYYISLQMAGGRENPRPVTHLLFKKKRERHYSFNFLFCTFLRLPYFS